jgi:alpha-mannosidase/mannosylglycerate hydrolase
VIGPARASDDVSTPVLAVDGDVIVTALKPAEDGRGAILRFVNPGLEPVVATVNGPFRVVPARLDETELDSPPAEIGPSEIRTLRLLGA